MRTKLCDLLTIDYPIFQGGMAWVATAELAAAVSEAGGLGIIGAGNAPSSWLQDQIRRARCLTSRPVGVNLYCVSPFLEEAVAVVAEEKVPLVTTGAGSPVRFVERLHSAGTLVFPVVGSLALARRLAHAGVDGIVAEGSEAGGHVGETSTLVLVPQVVDAVDLPVVGAGGIADGRQFAAVLALGAVGVQAGTRFLCATEANAHPAYKAAVLAASDRSTMVTGRSIGHPVRVLRNRLALRFAEAEARGASREELGALGAGALQAAAATGDVDGGSLMAGEAVAMVRREEPAAEIMRDLVDGAMRALTDLAPAIRAARS